MLNDPLDNHDDVLEVPFINSPSSLSRERVEPNGTAVGASPARPTSTANIPFSSAPNSSANHKLQLDIVVPNTDSAGPHPVYFHVHGGGWKRGDRQIPFYGAPAMAQFAAETLQFVAVTPSYRLGKYPDFIFDVVEALVWTHENIRSYGGDPTKIVLSGHSAGAHIVAMVLLRGVEQFSLPQRVRESLRACVLLSGVYSLEAPMYHKRHYPRNAIFRSAYVKNTFGTDSRVVDDASPSVFLLACGASTPSSKTTCSFFSCKSSAVKPTAAVPTATSDNEPLPSHVFPSELRNISFLVLNASCDLGLEVDGATFAGLLQSTGSRVQYAIVPSTNHASICWNPATHNHITAFVESTIRRF